jgi:hypothetical protein
LVKRGGKLPPHLIALLQKDSNTVTQVSNTVNAITTPFTLDIKITNEKNRNK